MKRVTDYATSVRVLAFVATFIQAAVPSSLYAQPAFNGYNGGCPGASYRLKLIRDSLIGTWVSAGDEVLLYDSIEHYTDRNNNDRQKDCEECCRASFHYDSNVRFNGTDHFGNTTGNQRFTSTNRQVVPDPDYLRRHNRVYSVECGDGGLSNSAGPVFVRLEVQVRNGTDAQTDGECTLSRMTLTYDDGSAYNVNMLSPTLMLRLPPSTRGNERLYHKQ